jgi:primary-amine oxidase
MDASSKKNMYNSCPLDAGYYANLLPHNSTLEPDSTLRGSKGYKMPDAAQLHAPDGCAIQRFGNHTFRWRGWDFHIASDPFSGLALHDVRFLNETYAYRIALSDVYATYWGGQNHHLLYSDGGYDIGSWGVDLVEGVDCPPEAMYVWNTVDQTSALGTQFLGGAEGFHPVPPFPQEREPKSMRSICLFEMPEGRPLARHHFWAGETNPAYVGMPSTILVARTISTVGNYDYIFDVHFWLDGKMQLSEGATGIATMSYPFLPGEDAWKQQFGPFAKGDLHLHSAGWELDLDVAGGTDNTFVETTYDWTSFPDGMSEAFTQGESNTVVPNRKVIESEQSVQPTEHATYYVRSEGSKNMFGNQKSLKIIAHKTGHPGGDADVRTFFHNISKATYHVVKKNVGEHFGACFQARGDPNSFKCGNDISDFLNDETLNDGGQGTDIVLYVGTNVMHDVVAEDMPMPAVFRDTIMIKPANMFDKAAFKDLSQTLGEGIGSGGTCLPLKMSAPEKTP